MVTAPGLRRIGGENRAPALRLKSATSQSLHLSPKYANDINGAKRVSEMGGPALTDLASGGFTVALVL